jgi:hypothetical protein
MAMAEPLWLSFGHHVRLGGGVAKFGDMPFAMQEGKIESKDLYCLYLCELFLSVPCRCSYDSAFLSFQAQLMLRCRRVSLTFVIPLISLVRGSLIPIHCLPFNSYTVSQRKCMSAVQCSSTTHASNGKPPSAIIEPPSCNHLFTLRHILAMVCFADSVLIGRTATITVVITCHG